MAARFRISIVGLSALRERYTIEHFRQVMMQALPEAFEPARAAVQAAAPRGKTLRLARAITTKVLDRRGSGIRVQIRSGAGYGHLVEAGHRLVVGGRIPRGRLLLGGRLALGGRYQGRVIGQVPPHPFAEPAFRATEGAVAALLEQRLVALLGVP